MMDLVCDQILRARGCRRGCGRYSSCFSTAGKRRRHTLLVVDLGSRSKALCKDARFLC